MEKYFTGICLELFNGYVDICKEEEKEVSYNEFLKLVGVEVNEQPDAIMYSSRWVNPSVYYLTANADKKKLKMLKHTSVNNLVNLIFGDGDIMIYDYYAHHFESWLTSTVYSYEEYKELDLFHRLAILEIFNKAIGYITLMDYDSKTFREKGAKSYSIQGHPEMTVGVEQFGEVIVESYKSRYELISRVNNHYNNRIKFNKSAVNTVSGELMERKVYPSINSDEAYQGGLDLAKIANDYLKVERHVQEEPVAFLGKQIQHPASESKSNPVEDFIQSIEETFNGVTDTIRRKNSDYTGDNFNPFHNFEKSIQYGVNPVDGMLVRIQDKMSRLHALANGHDAKVDEKIEDTLTDAIGYIAILSAFIQKNGRSKEESLSLSQEIINELATYKQFISK